MQEPARNRYRRPAIGPETSGQIVALRVICIFFMMSVHVSPGFDNLNLTPAAPMYWIGRLWVDVLGRSSVPALSIVSGFLMAAHFGRRSLAAFALDRFRTLILPMLFWTALLATLALAARDLLGAETETWRRFFADGPVRLVLENMLFLYGHPANVPLAFLRDLFVCSLIAWGLQAGLGRRVVLALPVSVAIWQAGGYGALILRPSILSFVLAGIALQHHVGHLTPGRALRAAAWGLMAVALLHQWFGLLTPLEAATPPQLWALVFRTTVSIWALDAAILLSQSRFFPLLRRLEPVVYLAYLSHGVVISCLWMGVSPLIGGAGSAAYPVFFLAAPVLALLAAQAGDTLLGHGPDWARTLIGGKARPAATSQRASA